MGLICQRTLDDHYNKSCLGQAPKSTRSAFPESGDVRERRFGFPVTGADIPACLLTDQSGQLEAQYTFIFGL
jgi:hypothetical protein